MPYRDETDGLRARVAELEAELDQARDELDALRQGRGVVGRSNWLLGGPTELRVERTAAGALDDDKVERVVIGLRERFGDLGRLDRVGRSVAWSTMGARRRLVQVVLEDGGATARVRVEEPLRGVAGGLFGGIIGGGGGGTLWLIVSLANEHLGGELVPVAVVVWLLMLYLLVRAAYGRVARRRSRDLAAVADWIVETLGQASVDSAPLVSAATRESAARVRVGTSTDEAPSPTDRAALEAAAAAEAAEATEALEDEAAVPETDGRLVR